MSERKELEACDHSGCKGHVTHPCEKCGRQWNPNGTINKTPLGPCPFCNGGVFLGNTLHNEGCALLEDECSDEQWNTRPREVHLDALVDRALEINDEIQAERNQMRRERDALRAKVKEAGELIGEFENAFEVCANHVRGRYFNEAHRLNLAAEMKAKAAAFVGEIEDE